MATQSGNGDSLLASNFAKVVASLATLSIVGILGIVYAQVVMSVQVEANKNAIEDQKAAVAAIPVIQSDIRHIKDMMESDVKRILAAIKENKK